MLAHAGIQTPDSPCTSPVNTTHYAMTVPFYSGCRLVEMLNLLPSKKSKSKENHIGMLNFGTVQVRNILTRCLQLKLLNLQTDKLTVLRQLLIIRWAISTYIWSKFVLTDQHF